MTEKEKRDAGLLYDAAHDEKLIEEMKICKDICFDYNAIKSS